MNLQKFTKKILSALKNVFSSKDSKYYDLQELKKLQKHIVCVEKMDKQSAQVFINELKRFHDWLKFKGETCSLFYNNIFLFCYLENILQRNEDYFTTAEWEKIFSNPNLQHGVNFLLNEGYENFKLIRDCCYKAGNGETGVIFTAANHEMDRFRFPNNFLPFHNSWFEKGSPDILRSYTTNFFSIFCREKYGVHIAINHNEFLKDEFTRRNSLAKFDYGNVSVFYKGKMFFLPEKSNHQISATSKFWRYGKFSEQLRHEVYNDCVKIFYNGLEKSSRREIFVREFSLHIYDFGGMYSEFRIDGELYHELSKKNLFNVHAEKIKVFEENGTIRLKMWGAARFLTLDFG